MSNLSFCMQDFEWLIADLRNSEQPIYLFGASRAGWYILKVLEHYNIQLAGIIDNDISRHGDYIGYSVTGVEVLDKQAEVVVGVFKPSVAQSIRAQLSKFGIDGIHYHMGEFLLAYFRDVVDRKCDYSVLASSLEKLYSSYIKDSDDMFFVSPSVTTTVTKYCSLSCRDCGTLIPYYENPCHFSVEQVVKDVQQYCKVFDVIPELCITGGEPFMHPHIEEICSQISSISNLVFINITTNGTIVPSQKKMKSLFSSGVFLHQSEYGDLSKRKVQLFEACMNNDIYCDVNFVNSNKKWTPLSRFVEHKRSETENDQIYNKCDVAQFCYQIMNSQLHRCPLSMYGTDHGLISVEESDMVNLNEDQDESLLRRKIKKFITRKGAVSACDYCDFHQREMVSPAVQLEGKRKYGFSIEIKGGK